MLEAAHPRPRRALSRAAGLLLLAAPALAGSPVHLRIESPLPGARVEGHVHQARLTGSALADAADPSLFDVMMVLDTSGSTATASGGDVDGDGVVGVNPKAEGLEAMFPPGVLSTDPDDSILHAQVRSALALLDGLDPRRVRVGLITFSGEYDPLTGMRLSPTQQDAWLEAPLGSDLGAVRRALAGVLARGPHGATNYSAGVLLAVNELAGLTGARSVPRPDAKRVILFLTDGVPTFPIGSANELDPGDAEAALRAAELAQAAGISINTYALGPEALKYPRVATEMARTTRGVYTPIQNPDDVIVLLAGTSFSDVEDVVFTNLSTGDFSTDVRLAPDGTFTGYLPVREGKNRVRIIALASDGSRGELELELDFQLSQVGARDKLGELERIRRQNKELELRRRSLEIEAFREQQRKRLDVRVADPTPQPAPAPQAPTEGEPSESERR